MVHLSTKIRKGIDEVGLEDVYVEGIPYKKFVIPYKGRFKHALVEALSEEVTKGLTDIEVLNVYKKRFVRQGNEFKEDVDILFPGNSWIKGDPVFSQTMTDANVRRHKRQREPYIKMFLAGKAVGGQTADVSDVIEDYLKSFGCRICRSFDDLNISHINDRPYDHHTDNLECLCQKCHIQYSKEHNQYSKTEGGRNRTRNTDSEGLKYRGMPSIEWQKNKVKEEWEARNTGISFEDALGPYKNCHGRKRKER